MTNKEKGELGALQRMREFLDHNWPTLKAINRSPPRAELDELVALRGELQDRYGPPPEPMRNLLYGVEVKLRAAKAGATEVRVRGPELRIVMGRDLGDAQRRAILSVFPKAQHGQRQVRASILEARGDWRDALTRVLEGLGGAA